jgi:hypothetical protein
MLDAYLPAGYSEATDIIKVFATQQPTSFRWLELPPLDQPPIRTVGVERAAADPLEQLLRAFTGDTAPSREDMQARALKVVTVPKAEKTWSVAQVEIRVKK